MSYADVNGVSLFYEEHGSGQPLILLHGGLGMGEMYAPILPLLAKGRRVITVDLQAHGHTADVDRPLRHETLADDIAGLIGHLGLAQADVMGYSFGGATALRTAIQHPDLVRRLVVVSVASKRDGWYPESLAGMDQMGSQLAEMLKGSPMYQIYAQVAPSSSSTLGSAAACATRTGTARPGPWRGSPSCPVIPITTFSPRPTSRPRSSRSWTRRRCSRRLRSGRERTAAADRNQAGARTPVRRRSLLH